ncbi:MAG: 4-hydroxy-3-methylbut-2-enyl diphosphate reductase [Flavobacteriales bacterium]|nr:4-hydroxy-3-methylbut-2-enyl diphosphate reductase [Flavobacteriales bacterium]
MKVTIDKYSGFCFGVVYAIEMAEVELSKTGKLYCLGDIVHNNMEVDRLNDMGLEIINHQDLDELKDCKVLIRAHGEPPETYHTAIKNNIQLLDASCPVVLKLQYNIKEGYEEINKIDGQIIIFGKEGHAEVQGLLGQTDGKAIIVASADDLDKVDFSSPIYMYSQTTKSPKAFADLQQEIRERKQIFGNTDSVKFIVNDTLCRQVSGREPQLKEFAKENDVIVFVSGKKSSNGKMLFQSCLKENQNSYFVSEEKEIKEEWFNPNSQVGICGATSTPRWLMENVAKNILQLKAV